MEDEVADDEDDDDNGDDDDDDGVRKPSLVQTLEPEW